MSTLQKIGSLLWLADKLKQVTEAAEIAQNATDPMTREQAALDAATKLAEAVGIGIPLWFIDQVLTKTGLDRVFDTLKKNKSFEAYLEDQIAKKNFRDITSANVAEWGLSELREWISLNGSFDPIFDVIFDLVDDWNTAKQTVSPLILDLDGDGVVETQSKTEGIYFDHAGDGFAEASGWAGSDDGLLVRDLNGDGAINNGTELFGNNTRLKNGQYAANGFEALKDLDSNKDGKLNSADAAWNSLRVWKDTDADAQTDAGELLSLANAGVREIKLAYTNAGTNPDQLGNEHIQTSTYTTTSGTARFTMFGSVPTTGTQSTSARPLN